MCPAWQSGSALNGGPWTSYNDPELSTWNLVWGGQALSPTDVTIVGGTYGAGRLAIFNGVTAAHQTIPNTASLGNVLVLDATTRLAIGRGAKFNYDCIMLSYTGNDTWITVPGTPSLGSGGCLDIWGSGLNDLFLLGWDGNGLHIFRGPKTGPWTEMALPALPTFNVSKLWGTSSSDVYAVGCVYQGNACAGGLLLHYDGNVANQWKQIQVDPMFAVLTAVHGSGPCNVAVGGDTNSNPSQGATIYYDGNSWSAPALSLDINVLFDVKVRGPNQVMSTGETPPPFNTSKFGADNGQRGLNWTIPAAQYGYLRSLALVPNSDMVFVFGDTGANMIMSAHWN